MLKRLLEKSACLVFSGPLLGFSFSGGTSRLDTKRQLIVQEANAIGTAYLRLDLLPASNQPEMRRLYLDTRLRVYQKLPDQQAAEQELAHAERIQQEIWSRAVAASRDDPSRNTARLLLPALNEMIDITTSRTIALHTHLPPLIFALLMSVALPSGVLAGYAMAKRKTPIQFVAPTQGSSRLELYLNRDLTIQSLSCDQCAGYKEGEVDTRNNARLIVISLRRSLKPREREAVAFTSGANYLLLDRFHGRDVLLAHRLHLLAALCPLARPYTGCGWLRASRLRPLEDCWPDGAPCAQASEVISTNSMGRRLLDFMASLPLKSRRNYRPRLRRRVACAKAVLPALVPEMSYAEMQVANGQDAGLGVGGFDSLFLRTSHFRARLLHHLYQNLPGFCRVAHFSQECNASAPHAILGFQSRMKAEAVDRGHRCFLRLNACKYPGEQDERILVVSIHVLNDFAYSVSQRVGLRVVIIRVRNPAHHPEATHVINVHHVHPVEGKIFKVHPVLAVSVTRQE